MYLSLYFKKARKSRGMDVGRNKEKKKEKEKTLHGG